MKKITIKDVLGWDPCEEYTEERITKLFAGRESLTVADILELDIPWNDKLWAVSREELIPAPILHEFACRCAEEALTLVDNPDPRSVAAIAAKRAWLKGEITDDQLSAAGEKQIETLKELLEACDEKIKSISKVYWEGAESYFVVGKKPISNRGMGTVTEITYHEPSGEGDAHYCDVLFDSGDKTRLFRPDAIDWSESEVEK
jgi:hypothetical protein